MVKWVGWSVQMKPIKFMVVYRCQYYSSYKLYICQKVCEKGSLTLSLEHQVSSPPLVLILLMERASTLMMRWLSCLTKLIWLDQLAWVGEGIE
jgi:hypothetical protein